MYIGKVVGNVVCTPKHEALTGIKLMIVRRYVAGKPAGLLIAGTHFSRPALVIMCTWLTVPKAQLRLEEDLLL